MKRIHIGLDVQEIDRSIEFYNDLFGVSPVVRKPDYAKWMLDDPKVNFSITTRDCVKGGVHFGIQVESEEELSEVATRLEAAERDVLTEQGTTCCYHQSDKVWALDPDEFRWETFFTKGQEAVYGASPMLQRKDGQRCC